MTVIHYNHKKREFRNDQGRELTLAAVKTLWNDGMIEDCSISLRSLANCDWDFDALDKYYAEFDG